MERDYYISLFEKYLSNEANQEERELLISMLRQDFSIQRMLENHLKKESPDLNVETSRMLFKQINEQITPPKRRTIPKSLLKKTMRWAAILLLPIASALSVYFFMGEPILQEHQPITISTAKGEKAQVILVDGSRVWINSCSSLTYDANFNRNGRNIWLSGEAYFEVAQDERLPFVVQTNQMSVQALGTAFNVKAYDDESVLSSVLLEGKVKVEVSGQEYILQQNERVTFNKELKSLHVDAVHAADFIEWKNGRLYFDNLSFDEIALTLERVYNVDIQFASERLRPIRFSGTLGSSTIRNALDILSLTSPMRYEMNGTTFELYFQEK